MLTRAGLGCVVQTRFSIRTLYNLRAVSVIQLGKCDGSKVSNLETSAWQRQSIARFTLGVESKPRWSNAICLVTVERSKSFDTISFVKLNSSNINCDLFLTNHRC